MDQTADAKNVSSEKKTKKKKHVGLWVSLSIFVFLPLLLVGGTIGAIHYFFYDSTKPPQPSVAEGYDEETAARVIKAVGIDSLDNTETEKKILLELPTDDINNIIYGKFNDMLKGTGGTLPEGIDLSFVKKFISGFGVRTDDDVCNFEIGTNLPLLKTRAILETNVEKNEDGIGFKIQDIKIGKVQGLLDKIKSIPVVGNLIDDSKIQPLFSALPITLTSDLANNRIMYKTENMAADINKFLGNDNDNVYSHIMNEFFVDDIYKMDFVKIPDWDGLRAQIDLTTLGEKSYEPGQPGERFYDPTQAENPVDWKDYSALTVKALNKGIIEAAQDEANLKAFYNYAIRGYDKCSNKDFIDDLGDLSSIGIADTHAYTGIYSSTPESGKITDDGKSIKDIVTDQIAASEIALGKTISVIKEDQLNDMLRKSTALGETFILQRDLSEGTEQPKNYKMSTFVISNIYTNIYQDNSIDLTVTISVNGYPIYLYLRCTDGLYDSSAQAITFRLKDENMHFGRYQASSGFKSTIFNLLSEATQKAGVVELDPNSQTLSLNLATAIADSGKGPAIALLGGTELIMTGATLADEGTINLKIHS